jgi:hypothetical protein
MNFQILRHGFVPTFVKSQKDKYQLGVNVQYNISVNEKLGAYMYGFPSGTAFEDVLIYNNTHYFGAGLNASPIASPAKERIPINATFYNNIFYFEDSGSWAVSPDQGCVLSNNLFYNGSPKGQNDLTSDALFENPGSVDFDIDMTDPERLSGYRIKSSSPCINAGIKVDNNGYRDFWGNAVGTETMDIGAHEKQ